MKTIISRLFCLIFIFFSSCKSDSSKQEEIIKKIPDPKTLNETFVSDPDRILQSSTISYLNSTLKELDISGKAHIDVVIVSSIDNQVPKDIAYKLFNTWKIGSKITNNGLLIFLVLDQRRVEFETGYGLEDILTDMVCGSIQREYMIPHLKQENYDEAILSAVKEIIKALDTGYYAFQYDTTEPETDSLANNEVPSFSDELLTETDNNDQNYFYDNNNAKDKGIYINYPFFLIFFSILGLLFIFIKKIRGCIIFILLFFVYFFGWIILFYSNNFNITVFILSFYIPLTIFFSIKYYKVYANDKETDRYLRYLYMNESVRILKIIRFIFPIILYFLCRKFIKRMDELRNDPYTCKKCRIPMIKLSEENDNIELTRGKVLEENLNSVDYDVWICNGCDSTLTLKYPNLNTTLKECPKCHYITSKFQKDEIISHATTYSSGEGVKTYKCENCGKINKTKYTIPKLSDGSGSSSSSGSSFSSSSGGSSGGGGAGSSW